MTALGPGPRTRGFVHAALWLTVASVAGYHLLLELSTIGLKEPMGMCETIYASIARAWPHQYQWGNFVLGQDNYGPGYPALTRLFLALGVDVYAAHRLANLASLASACALLFWLLRSNRCPVRWSSAITAIFFAINAGSFSIQARPDFMALLEITAILAVGQFAALGRISPAVCGPLLGLLTLAGYLTKPYSLFAWAAALGGIFFCRGVWPAVRTGAVSAVVWMGGIFAYAYFNPLYLLETFEAHVARTALDFGWFMHQTQDFGLLACGPILLAASFVVQWPHPRDPTSEELLLRRYWGRTAGLAVIVLVTGLGWHDGAYLTYFIHLALVPVCVCAALAANRMASDALWPDACLMLNLAVLMATAPDLPRADPGWESLSADVLAQPGPVIVDFLMEPLSRERPGVSLADTGMVRFALDEPYAVRRPSGALTEAKAEVEQFTREQSGRMKTSPPSALYLQCVYIPTPGGPPGSRSLRIQDGLVWYAGDYLKDFVGSETFHIHPYYFGTNGRRQAAGRWDVLVIKFLRKPGPHTEGPPRAR